MILCHAHKCYHRSVPGLQKQQESIVKIADEILTVMEKHTAAGRHNLEVVAAVGIACKLFAVPSDQRKSSLHDPESVSELQESASVV